MKYLEHNKNYWACDIEADNLLDDATCIWCVAVENIETGEKRVFTEGENFRDWLSPDYILVGHNFIAYDLPMLNRYWQTKLPVSRIVDTFILSQLYNPSFVGGHSLEAWGKRLKFPKGEFNDFTKLTPAMVEYCAKDTSLTRRLYLRLAERMRQVGFTEEGCEIEYKAWNIIQNKQRRHGFPFNKEKAELLYVELLGRQRELEQDIYSLWPPKLCVVGEYAKAYKLDGTPTALYQRHLEQYPRVEEDGRGGYRVYDFVAFNLGSPQQRIVKLLELGWTPSKRTKKGNPQVDEEELLEFANREGIPELQSLSKWLMVSSRARMVKTWLEAYNEKTGAIHGKLFLASTLRYRHSNPNSANIPAVRTYDKGHILEGKPKLGEEGTWAYECRDLFWAGRDGHSLVGIDAKGIQIRILLNYAFSEEAVRLYMEGDPHVNNAKLLGLANKPAAKKAFYTILMGGQGGRIAADQLQFGTVLTKKEGDRLRDQIIKTIPGFQELIDRLQDELERTGRIRLCDGTPILVPSPHMVIPYLLQGDESRIMKKAMVYIDEEIRKAGLQEEVWKVADIHDEGQYVSCNRRVSRFVEMATAVFPRVGEFFNYRIPIEGEAKVGKTWAETH